MKNVSIRVGPWLRRSAQEVSSSRVLFPINQRAVSSPENTNSGAFRGEAHDTGCNLCITTGLQNLLLLNKSVVLRVFLTSAGTNMSLWNYQNSRWGSGESIHRYHIIYLLEMGPCYFSTCKPVCNLVDFFYLEQLVNIRAWLIFWAHVDAVIKEYENVNIQYIKIFNIYKKSTECGYQIVVTKICNEGRISYIEQSFSNFIPNISALNSKHFTY